MTDQHTEETLPMADAVGEYPKPAVTVDLDEVGADYLRRARRDTALARWEYSCPPDLKQTDFQDPRLAGSAQRCREVLSWEYQRRGILATGASGVGKTRSMWALMRRLAEESREIRYFTAAEWFATLQAQVTYGRDESLAWIRALACVPVVFIDDLGQEAIQANRQDWAQGWLFQFLDRRLGNALPLFVTTNLTAKEIAGQNAETRGNPLVRRLIELCQVVRF